MLRGVDGEADLFVIGDRQTAGVPFIENINPAEGDGILLFVGDILMARREALLADPDRRAAAIEGLRLSLGREVVAALSPAVVADLIDARIEADHPLPAFSPSQINTYGGFVFDVFGRRPLAAVSNYSQATGDTAWSTMSPSIAAGIFSFGDLTLSAATVPENVIAGSVVGELANELPFGQGDSTFTFVRGPGDNDNALFTIVRDESGYFPRSFLVAQGPFDYESDPRLSIRVRATGAGGEAFERVFVLDVIDGNDAPVDITLSTASVAENLPAGTPVGMLATTDPNLDDSFTYTLVPGVGSADNASFEIVGGELRTATTFDFETRAAYSVRIRSTDSGGLMTEKALTITVRNIKEAPTVTLPEVFTVFEDMPGPVVFLTPPLGTSDAPPTKKVTVVVRVESGTIMARKALGVTVGGTGQARTFSGTIAALNQFFTDPAGRVRYRPAADDHGSRWLRMAVIEATRNGVLRQRATSVIEIAPVNDPPLVLAPAVFRVLEDTPGRISWAAVATPFADVDSPNLTVTLGVASGVIDAQTGHGVTVGGTDTARTFVGSTTALNAYFKSLGRITYTTAPDATASQRLTTTVSDGALTTTARTQIRVTPVNDRPTIATSATFLAAAGQPVVITYARLLAASTARDVDGDSLRFRIESLTAGRIEKWNGSRWVAVRVNAGQPLSPSNQPSLPPRLGPGERIRWVPPVGATGTIPAFAVRVSDGGLRSLDTCQVSITAAG